MKKLLIGLLVFALGQVFVSCKGENLKSFNLFDMEDGRKYGIETLQVNNTEQYAQYRLKTKRIFEKSGGKILKEFITVNDPNGTISYGTINRLILFSFETMDGFKKLRANPEYTEHNNLLFSSADNIKIFLGDANRIVGKDIGELYILKISNYKNDDGEAQKVAAKINNTIRELYGFYWDTTIKSRLLIGLDRADTVGLYHYKEASRQKELFQDKEVMQSIGEFNKKYLDNYVYLTLKPINS